MPMILNPQDQNMCQQYQFTFAFSKNFRKSVAANGVHPLFTDTIWENLCRDIVAPWDNKQVCEASTQDNTWYGKQDSMKNVMNRQKETIAITSLSILHALRRGTIERCSTTDGWLGPVFWPSTLCALPTQSIAPDHGETVDSLATKAEGQWALVWVSCSL